MFVDHAERGQWPTSDHLRAKTKPRQRHDKLMADAKLLLLAETAVKNARAFEGRKLYFDPVPIEKCAEKLSRANEKDKRLDAIVKRLSANPLSSTARRHLKAFAETVPGMRPVREFKRAAQAPCIRPPIICDNGMDAAYTALSGVINTCKDNSPVIAGVSDNMKVAATFITRMAKIEGWRNQPKGVENTLK